MGMFKYMCDICFHLFDHEIDRESHKVLVHGGLRKCNSCKDKVFYATLEQKYYCDTCAINCFKECIRCHRAFNSEFFFQRDERRCNYCQLIVEEGKFWVEYNKARLPDLT